MVSFKDIDDERGKWVLTKDRLPNLEGEYLVTYKRKYLSYNLVCLSKYENGAFDMDNADIIAWRHLPLPYTN